MAAPEQPPSPDGGIAEVEGYLLFSAHLEEAKRAAAAFTEELPWLTSGQRAEVERVYVRDRMVVCRDANAGLLRRIEELRAEYTRRYRGLRARCVAATLAATAVAAGAMVTAGQLMVR